VKVVIASSVKMLLLNQLIKQGSGWWTRHLSTYVVRHIGLGWFWYSVAAPFLVQSSSDGLVRLKLGSGDRW